MKRILLLLVCLATFTSIAHAEMAGRFDFKKRITVSAGVQREFYQPDNLILGKNDIPQWTAGLFGSFRLGKFVSIVGSQTRGLEQHDWRSTVGVRYTIYRGAKTPLDTPPVNQ